MAKLRINTEKGIVTFNGRLTENDKFMLQLYASQGYTVKESKPKKKSNGKSKAAWIAAITDSKDKKEFEKLCASPAKGGKGFFGAVEWAKEKGYKLPEE